MLHSAPAPVSRLVPRERQQPPASMAQPGFVNEMNEADGGGDQGNRCLDIGHQGAPVGKLRAVNRQLEGIDIAPLGDDFRFLRHGAGTVDGRIVRTNSSSPAVTFMMVTDFVGIWLPFEKLTLANLTDDTNLVNLMPSEIFDIINSANILVSKSHDYAWMLFYITTSLLTIPSIVFIIIYIKKYNA